MITESASLVAANMVLTMDSMVVLFKSQNFGATR